MTALAPNTWDLGRWTRPLLMLLALLALFAFASNIAGKAWAQTTPPTTEAPKQATPAKPDVTPAQDTKPAEPPKTEEKKEEKKKPSTLNSGDTAWMLTSTALVLLMTIPGVALFYGGMVRRKNVLSTVMHVFAVCCLISVVWVVIGYSLAFKGEGAYLGNASALFLKGIAADTLFPPEESANAIPETVFVMFQMTFAIITPALIVGAYVDRMKFAAMVVFMVLWSIVVYSPIAHWVWGGGWVAKAGALDFAGGTVVHINAGVAGLVAAFMLGKRVGFGTENMAPHNLTLSVIGASMLWVGWFGFNAGSALEAGGTASLAMLNTFVATAGAALAWLLAENMSKGKPSLLGAVTGAVAGLVAVTPAAGFAGPMGAIVLGLVAGFVCFIACSAIKNALGYDDALDVFGVHGVGGIVGAIGTGILAAPFLGGTGVFDYTTGKVADFDMVTQVISQIKAVCLTIVWSGLGTLILLTVVRVIVGLRPATDQEREGLDLVDHGERAYNY